MDFAFVTDDIASLLDQIGHNVILQKVTKFTDTYGRTTSKTTSTTTIRGYIHPLSADNVELQQVGWVAGRDAMGIFLTTASVAKRDKIVDGTNIYEVAEIMQKPQVGTTQPFVRCRLRVVNNG